MSRMPRKFKTDRRNTIRKGDSMTIMDQYIELATMSNGKIPIYKSQRTGENCDRTDEKVKVCTKCGIAWESPLSGSVADTTIIPISPPLAKKERTVRNAQIRNR